VEGKGSQVEGADHSLARNMWAVRELLAAQESVGWRPLPGSRSLMRLDIDAEKKQPTNKGRLFVKVQGLFGMKLRADKDLAKVVVIGSFQGHHRFIETQRVRREK
jgi:hypothetical protein